jgi:CubicO group peptidase (beta-lactamase class C family)
MNPMNVITRRTFFKSSALALSAGVLPGLLPFSARAAELETQPVPTTSEENQMAEIVNQVMQDHHAPALSLAIARHGQLVYQQAYGCSNQQTGEPATTDNLFRIASISKPITSVAIFTLIEQGRLGLHDFIFGEQGVLKFDYVESGGSYPDRVSEITLYHLLTHTCGGWENDDHDPMFRHPNMDHRQLITWALQAQPLKYDPGVHYVYSNFGFCILGRVIEKVTGQPYAEYVKQTVLARCGIEDMKLAGNTLAERAPGEVIYYGQNGSGTNPYGMNVTRMDSHGGWLATPTDLVNFALHVDGFKTTPSILNPDSVKTMTTGSPANAGYACGWCVNRIPNWWHSGSLPGTLTIMVRTTSGLCWAAFTNTRSQGMNLDNMMWQVVKSVPAWRA